MDLLNKFCVTSSGIPWLIPTSIETGRDGIDYDLVTGQLTRRTFVNAIMAALLEE